MCNSNKKLRTITTLLLLLTLAINSSGQKYNYPGQLEVKTYKIGDRVDTTRFKRYASLYFPNHLDGWNMENVSELPDKYKGLPIAIWQLKSDSSICLTLLDNIVLNIVVSFMKVEEKVGISKMLTEKFGASAQLKSYEEAHPLQSWITYWNLETWETKDVIFQLGNSNMRKPKDPKPKEIVWNLVYSDFILENKIIDVFKTRK